MTPPPAPPPPAPAPPGLDELLSALRADGLPIGPREVARLQRAFATAPRLDRERLREFLACLLAKTPAERALLERHFAVWCPDLPAEWAAGASRPAARVAPAAPGRAESARHREPEPFDPPPLPWQPPRWVLALGVITALLAAGVLAYLVLRPSAEIQIPPPPPPEAPVAIPEQPERDGLSANPAPQAWYWRAEIRAIVSPDRLAPEELALGGVLAALLALGLWWRYRRRHPAPAALPPTAGGPAWLPLPAVHGSDTALLAPRERRGLVWNISRFAAEDQTRRLDEPATADATARAGGLAEPRWRRARFPREVWLWCDEHCPDPALTALAEEIATSLTRAGLSVRRGAFAGSPHRVWWRRDDHFEPGRMEGHRQHALVALLTDGQGLDRALDAPLESGRTARLLRQLRLWPHLALVDFGPPGRLARRLRRFGLTVLAPQQLSTWLGGSEPARRAPQADVPPGELRLWAAACCVGAEPLDVAAAQRLRVHLGLHLEPWAIRALADDAGDSGLRWPEPRRRAHLTWLLGTLPWDHDGRPDPDSPAVRAIRWWRERYRRAAGQRAGRESRLLPWRDTGARRRWALEDALLELLLAPELAVPRLRALAQADEGLRTEIRDRLGAFRAADAPWPVADGEERVVLRWRLAALPDRTQQALAWLGLGGLRPAHPGPALAAPPRLAVALGALSGIALAALLAALWRWAVPPGIQIASLDPLHDHPTLAAQTLRLIDDQRGTVRVGSARASLADDVPPGARVEVDWSWGPTDNPTRLRDGSDTLLLRAGTIPQPIRPCDDGWPARSLAYIESDPAAPAARRLAIRLLDSGTADQVGIGRDWAEDLAQLVGNDPVLDDRTRVLVITRGSAPSGHPNPGVLVPGVRDAAVVSASFDALAEWLDFAGTRPLAAAPVEIRWHRGVLPWHGRPEPMRDPRTGIDWVRVCPGTFTMGSDPDTDPMSQEDERPAHPVALDGFWIARTETTNAQYRRWPKGRDHAGGADGDLPAVSIDWQDARDFCRWAGADLPAEAQWERAARAGTLTPWSFGADQDRLVGFAWFEDNSGREAHPVGRKAPNPLGLRDMHGNVWEWVRDWYGDYPDVLAVEPDGPRSGDWRVVRGGSFDLSPVGLRSARRDDFDPVNRSGNLGFRCARVSPPQH